MERTIMFVRHLLVNFVHTLLYLVVM